LVFIGIARSYGIDNSSIRKDTSSL